MGGVLLFAAEPMRRAASIPNNAVGIDLARHFAAVQQVVQAGQACAGSHAEQRHIGFPDGVREQRTGRALRA